MLICGIATQALRVPKLRLLKGEFWVSVPATWPLVWKLFFVSYMFLQLKVQVKSREKMQ